MRHWSWLTKLIFSQSCLILMELHSLHVTSGPTASCSGGIWDFSKNPAGCWIFSEGLTGFCPACPLPWQMPALANQNASCENLRNPAHLDQWQRSRRERYLLWTTPAAPRAGIKPVRCACWGCIHRAQLGQSYTCKTSPRHTWDSPAQVRADTPEPLELSHRLTDQTHQQWISAGVTDM